MGKFSDLTGKIFGNWKVLHRTKIDPKKTFWLCECSCGMNSNVMASHLVGGKSTKCKTCHNKIASSKRPLKHGHSSRIGQTKEYQSWCAMRTRCTNVNNEHWGNYGGRGIKVSIEWNDFSNFLKDMGERPKKYTLDRIDVNGNYSKENCRWASNQTQCRNKRTNILLEKDGIVKTKTQWAKDLNIPYTSFARMINKFGWPLPPAPIGLSEETK